LVVCPNCSNCLTIALTAGTDEYPEGVNAFQCRTCPYQFILDKPYYERAYMKKKQRDDVMGEDQSSLPVNDGEPVFTSERYRNAAKRLCYSAWWMPGLSVKEGIFLPAANEECR
jgi:DNA-directed RNA polymerase subunit M/transcription elongation factor TFIIS